jgi:hypothetical protein
MSDPQPVDESASEKGVLKQKRLKVRRWRYRSQSGRLARLKRLWFVWRREVIFVVLLLTAVLFLVNPFRALAQARALVAQPVTPLLADSLEEAPDEWCLTGNFLEWNGRDYPMNDAGLDGDQRAEDGIYTRVVTFAESGRYQWRVLPCRQWDLAFPNRAAWAFVLESDQTITFTMDTNPRGGKLWPERYVVSANDQLPARLLAVGDFQKWNNTDPATVLRPLRNGVHQLVYAVHLPGVHRGYVAINGRRDGFGADGRSSQAIPLQFTTEALDETVIFLFDGRSERMAILYGLPFWLSWLAYRRGALLLGGLTLLAAMLTGGSAVQVRLRRRRIWQFSQGCPQCQQHQLKRTHRKASDYLLSMAGFPVRRYICAHCGWRGRRIHQKAR